METIFYILIIWTLISIPASLFFGKLLSMQFVTVEIIEQ